jgi:Ni/Co efflux regulator RcnB
MSSYKMILRLITPLAIAGLLVAGPAVAGKPSWAGKGKKQDDGAELVRVSNGAHFSNHDRLVVREYIQTQYARGHCPPGLAKKNNGCLPPGQAKKWNLGRPLPADVVIYDLPPRLTINLGAPPAGHRYVRVATDILLIAVGTGMVIDALDDLSRL